MLVSVLPQEDWRSANTLQTHQERDLAELPPPSRREKSNWTRLNLISFGCWCKTERQKCLTATAVGDNSSKKNAVFSFYSCEM